MEVLGYFDLPIRASSTNGVHSSGLSPPPSWKGCHIDVVLTCIDI